MRYNTYMKKMKLILLLSLFFTSLGFGAVVNFVPFIKAQMSVVERMNEDNVTKERIQDLLEEQNTLYSKTLDELMSNKVKYVKDVA